LGAAHFLSQDQALGLMTQLRMLRFASVPVTLNEPTEKGKHKERILTLAVAGTSHRNSSVS